MHTDPIVYAARPYAIIVGRTILLDAATPIGSARIRYGEDGQWTVEHGHTCAILPNIHAVIDHLAAIR